MSLLSTNEKKAGTISLYSPLVAKDHSIEFSYFGGHPYAIRGDINVKEDGSHKTLTEVDFESSFIPLNISSMLVPANRDTFVFAADSVPDTLETSINYRSFYYTVTIVKELPAQETDASCAAITVVKRSSCISTGTDITEASSSTSFSTDLAAGPLFPSSE